MNKRTNIAFIAFLAWMATLLALTCVNANAQTHQDPAWESQEVVINLVKQIVISHAQNTCVDSPCESSYEAFVDSERAMLFAYNALREFTDLSHEEIEVALGAAGYNRAMHWAKWSDPLGHF